MAKYLHESLQETNRSRQRSRLKKTSSNAFEGKRTRTTNTPPADETLENVIFFGEEFTPDEYRAACQNLSDFFSILARWAEKAKQDEKKTQQ
mgnify:CR=1 FL=1